MAKGYSSKMAKGKALRAKTTKGVKVNPFGKAAKVNPFAKLASKKKK